MKVRPLGSLAGLLALALAGALAARKLPGPPPPAIATAFSGASSPAKLRRSEAQFARPAASAGAAPGRVLELPRASVDFVGHWGGYIHSSIDRISPLLTGRSPDRVSVVFGRQGDAVFLASDLYTGASQRLLRQPTVFIVDPGSAVIKYESEDRELFYVCTHRFDLAGNGRMRYRSTIAVYDRRNHRIMGIVTQRATLTRLLTAGEQRVFARPSLHAIPRVALSTRRSFGPD